MQLETPKEIIARPDSAILKTRCAFFCTDIPGLVRDNHPWGYTRFMGAKWNKNHALVVFGAEYVK